MTDEMTDQSYLKLSLCVLNTLLNPSSLPNENVGKKVESSNTEASNTETIELRKAKASLFNIHF